MKSIMFVNFWAASKLEIACGTGLWTQELSQYSQTITALDAVEEVIAINKNRLQDANIQYIIANIFDWRLNEKYDIVFFSFWRSHVPPNLFDKFWGIIGNLLNPNGRIFFIDSKYDRTSTANNHILGSPKEHRTKRILNDGRAFQIFKVFYKPSELLYRLSI